ncbi:hypothetical protein HaLaN_03336 [Haematococcus lacustris]|uniref:Uncharacterized protein n=1 Tax=Haematococcus lacustris TaxID=44745 RepID=A0A699YNA7_HAELA|nr:hypothetical protein HaLaN_03336 [Haematococcus lacustris]
MAIQSSRGAWPAAWRQVLLEEIAPVTDEYASSRPTKAKSTLLGLLMTTGKATPGGRLQGLTTPTATAKEAAAKLMRRAVLWPRSSAFSPAQRRTRCSSAAPGLACAGGCWSGCETVSST